MIKLKQLPTDGYWTAYLCDEYGNFAGFISPYFRTPGEAVANLHTTVEGRKKEMIDGGDKGKAKGKGKREAILKKTLKELDDRMQAPIFVCSDWQW